MSIVRPDEEIVPRNRAARRAAGHRARKIGALSSSVVLAGAAGAAVMGVMSTTPAGALTTFEVNQTTDAGDGTCDATCTLRDAVENATADADTSEIVFASNVTGSIVLTSGHLEVDTGGDLRVTGPGASVVTVDGNANGNIFYSDGGFGDYTLSISGLTLTNADEGNDGGAIEFYDDGGGTQSLVLTNMVITGNTAGDDGGGIQFYTDGDLTIINSTITGNTAGNDGGGIQFYGGNDLTITNSTISGNTASDDGGGLYFYGSGDLTITNSTITGNTGASGEGGGIGFDRGNDLTITNSTISGNTAGTDGGGIKFDRGDVLTITNSTISGNTSGRKGGGLYLDGDGVMTITNSTIAGNTAADTGGGIAVRGGGITLLQSTISGNTAGGFGDGLYLRSPNSDPVGLIGSIISANGEFDIDTNSTISVTSTNSLLGTNGAGITIIDAGGTITSTDPGLAALADNGGPTQTMALLLSSPAIDTGPDPVPSFTGNEFDQRGAGYPRVVNGRVDIGAYEFAPEVVVPELRFTG